jgi:hypothetical protein
MLRFGVVNTRYAKPDATARLIIGEKFPRSSAVRKYDRAADPIPIPVAIPEIRA